MTGVNSMVSKRGGRKVRRGIVISDKMDKTVVVKVERKFRHPVYTKIVRDKTNFKVHDPENTAHIGDMVEIMETRPLSREKRWRLVKIIGKSETREASERSTVDTVG